MQDDIIGTNVKLLTEIEEWKMMTALRILQLLLTTKGASKRERQALAVPIFLQVKMQEQPRSGNRPF